MNIWNTLIIIASLVGIYISWRIREEKQKKISGKQMVCFTGHSCETVLFSEYAKFFGFNIETLGFLYYAVSMIFYVLGSLFPVIFNDVTIFIFLGMAFGGLLFSIYLTFIQVYRLRNFCSWCLGSGAVSISIFVFALVKNFSSKNTFLEYIFQFHETIRVVQIASLVGAVIVSIVLEYAIIKFLRDLRIDERENRILRIISQTKWFVLFLYILSSIEILLNGAWLQIAIIFIILANFAFSTVKTIREVDEQSKIAEIIGDANRNRLVALRRIALIQSTIALVAWVALCYLNFL